MKKNIKFLLLIFIFILILLVFIIMLFSLKNNNDKYKTGDAVTVKTTVEMEKKANSDINDSIKQTLSGLSEQKRIEYYASQFIKALEARNISKAYRVLNDDFKNNYFNTQKSFEEYIKKYFPKETSIDYENIERLGEIYVLVVDVKDILSSDPNNFQCYIVVKENDLNDYELSFSVDSAMEKYSEETED